MIYRSAFIYRSLMKTLYGSGFENRYEAVAREIPDGAEVLDLCCGDARIYTNYLKQKGVNYLGMDASSGFLRNAVRHSVAFKVWRMSQDEIPEADYIVMMASLYQFHDQAPETLKLLLKRARKKLILTEPIVNMAQSQNPLFSKFARMLTSSQKRFNENSIQSLIESQKQAVEKTEKIANGREMLIVFNPRKTPNPLPQQAF